MRHPPPVAGGSRSVCARSNVVVSKPRSRVSISVAAVTLLLGSACVASAQTSVPPGGEGTVTLTYENYYVTGHFNPLGEKNKNGATHTKAVLTEFDYALTCSTSRWNAARVPG